MMRFMLFWCVVASLVACGPAHVILKPAPSAYAPEEVRLKAYNRLRPTASQRTLMVQVNGHANVAGVSESLDHILIGDGTRIVYPEDLLPVVPPDSRTAVSARASAEQRAIAEPLYYSGIGGFLVGTGLVMAGFLSTNLDVDSDDFGKRNGTLLGVGIVTAAVGVIAWIVGGFIGAGSATKRAVAFETYDYSLRQQLGICPDGTPGTDCH